MLRELGKEGGPLGVTAISRRMAIGKSTVHRLLTTLASEGFVRQTEDGRYGLGMSLWELGSRMVVSKVRPSYARHATSTGKSILAFCPPEVVESVIDGGLRRLGPGTLTDRAAFHEALEKLHDQRHVISLEESESGVASVGAPVFGHANQVLGAVSAAGPLQRFTSESIPRLVRHVLAAAGKISREMGHTNR